MANELREAGEDVVPRSPRRGTAIPSCNAGYHVPMRIWVTAKIKLDHWRIKQACANYEGIRLGVGAGQLGAAYFLPTFIVPLFVITHGLMFWLLLRNENEVAMPAARRPA